MDDDRPLFITFKPFGEDNTARAKPAPNTTPTQPQGAELPPGQHDRHGRVGHVDTRPGHDLCSPSQPSHAPHGLHWEQNILGACPHRSSWCCPLPSRSLQASGHLHQPRPCLKGTRGQSGGPCVPGRGCGLSRHKPRGWGPRGSSQRGSTASSAAGE